MLEISIVIGVLPFNVNIEILNLNNPFLVRNLFFLIHFHPIM